MLRWYYSIDSVTVLEITDRVNWPDIEIGSKAEAGSGWEGDLVVGDPDGDFVPLMFRRIYAVQDAAPAGGQVVGNWFISNLKVTRDNPKVLASRKWTLTMADENSLLSRRLMVGSDADRKTTLAPATTETDIERIRWLLSTTELNVLDPNEDFIDTTGPVDVDAEDLSGQSPEQILESLMKASGKSYGVMYREDLTPHVYTLWYFNQNRSTLYESTASLSNLLSEVKADPLVFPLSTTAELDRAGGRMASGMLGQYKTNHLYVTNSSVGEKYAYVDRVASDINVSSLAKATTEFIRQLGELDRPDDEITTTLTVQEDDLNLVMHGMRIPVHATHFPNYTDDTDPDIPGYQLPGYAADYVWCRVIERTVRQVGPKTFELPLRLSPQLIIPTEPVFCCLSWPSNGAGHNLHPIEWNHIGEDGSGTGPTYPNGTPTSGPVSGIVGTEKAWKGILIGGTIGGTVDVYAHSSLIIVLGAGTHTADFNILNNGIVVATASFTQTFTGLHAFSPNVTVSITGLAVVPGDEITHDITLDGGGSIGTVPNGAGDFSQRMVLTGNIA